MGLVNWLNANSGAVMGALTLVYVIGTFLICVSSYRANKIALDLHEAVYRPVVTCDFFTQYTVMYFRIRNLGNRSACDVRIRVTGPPPVILRDWSEHSAIKNGISCLSPGSEIVSLYTLPKGNLSDVRFEIDYTDDRGKKYSESATYNLLALGCEDVGRQNNDPIVKNLEKIESHMASIAKKVS